MPKGPGGVIFCTGIAEAAAETRRTGRPATGGAVSDYHINIFYSDEDGGYIADIPDLEACSAFGATAAEALAEVAKAREAWMQAARKAGKPIPPSRYRPVIHQAR